MANRHPLAMQLPLLEMGPAQEKNMSEGRREEDEKDWVDAHPGFDFGVYDGKTLLSKHPNIPRARRAAKKAIGDDTDIRVKDMHDTSRVYFHEGTA